MNIPNEQELWLKGMTSEEWLNKHDAEIRNQTITEIEFILCAEIYFGYEVEARVVEVLEQMKGAQK